MDQQRAEYQLPTINEIKLAAIRSYIRIKDLSAAKKLFAEVEPNNLAKENLMIAETCVQLKEMDKLPKIIEQSTTFADLAQLEYLFRQNNLEEQSQNCINKLMSMEKTNTDYDPKEIPSIPPSQAKILLLNSSAVILSECD